MKISKPKLVMVFVLLVFGYIFISVLKPSTASAASLLPTQSANSNFSSVAEVDVNVRIASIAGQPTSTGGGGFNGYYIAQVGNLYYLDNSSGAQIAQIPSTINLAITDVSSGQQLSTYCTSPSDDSTLVPCGGDSLIPNLGLATEVTPDGVITYTGYFSVFDETSQKANQNFVGCPYGPTGVTLTAAPACKGDSSSFANWTVKSCGAQFDNNFGTITGPCQTTLGQSIPGSSETNDKKPTTVDLALPLASNYVAPGIPGSTLGNSAPPTCDSSGFSLSWIACPVINAIAGAEKDLGNAVFSALKTTTVAFNNNDCTATVNTDCTYKVWSSFRIYGNIVLVIALLAVVFAEAIGGGAIEAYTVKKMLPRILIAAILINLSIYIVAALEDITNVVGGGLYSLISAPFADSGNWRLTLNGTAGDITGFAAIVAGPTLFALGGAAVGFILLFIGLPVLLAVIGVLVTLILRQGILIFLVMISPIAFALYCLPNTEQYFKKWWDLLFKTLLVYPIVVVVFVMADVTSGIVSKLPVTPQWVAQILGVIALVAPLFLIPFAFKISGGAIGAIQNAVNNFSGKTTEAIKGNVNDPNSLRNKTKRRLGENATRSQSSLIGSRDYRGGRRLVSKAADLFGNADARLAGYNKSAAERRDALTGFGNDALVYAGAGYTVAPDEKNFDGKTNKTSSKLYYNSKGQPISSDLYTKGKSLYGGSQHDVTQGSAYTIYKAQTDDDVSAMQFAFNKNAEAGNWTQEQIEGNWLGATYPYKGQFASVRYSVPQRGADGKVTSANIADDDAAYYKMLKDFHKTRPSFRLSEVRDQDWQNMHTQQLKLEDKVLTGTASPEDARNLAMTYEMFDAGSHEMYAGATQQQQEAAAAGGSPTTDISASGMTAASQAVIEDAVKSRQMNLNVTNTTTHEKELVPKPIATGTPLAGPGGFRHGYSGVRTTGDDIK